MIENIPKQVENFVKLTEFSAINIGLIEFPSFFLNHDHIITLNFAHNNLEDLPKANKPFGSNLKEIDLSHNIIKSISWNKENCNNLDYLNLSGNPLSEISLDLYRFTLRKHYQFDKKKGAYVGVNYDNKTLILNECYENIDEKEIARFIYIEKIYTLKIESSKLAHRILESDKICGVKCLKKIDLKWRPFRVYDENTGLHKVVKNIHHESARLYEIPDSIRNFIHLESIDFNGNRIKCIPYTISKLLNLKSLNISSNLLTQLPNEIDGLKNLMQLDVSSNIDLYQIPLSIFKLKKLQELNLGFIHKLDLLDPYIYKLNNLKYLNIESTSITVLPDGVCRLKRLEYLNISNTDIDIIPLCINELHELNCFELENTKIESLDHIKYGFKKLKTLNLGNNNNLKKLPDFVFLSPNIVSLNCSKCQISEISDKIMSLDKLQDLNFAQNILLKNLPASIQGLRKLYTLNLYGCKSLSILDLTKKSLPLLENLDIGETGITNLKGLSNLRSLKVLGCFNTPIEIIGGYAGPC